MENLEKARFEKGPMAAKARSYTIRKGSGIVPIEKMIPKAVHGIAQEFLNPPMKCFGYPGISKLGHEMLKWLDDAAIAGKDLHDQADMMENGGTGGAIFRNFFRDFLYECLEYLPNNTGIKRAADLYGEAASNWTETAGLIKKAGTTFERKYLKEASGICIQTSSIEKEAMEALLNV